MGEVIKPPEENDYPDESSEDLENSIDEEFEEEEEEEDFTLEEMKAIDSKLDALNLALDTMETKREKIHEQLMVLLESSREIRKELQEEQAMSVDSDPKENM